MQQSKQKPYLTYALDEDGKLIHVDSVSTGLSCKCFCPHCKNELVAKNGGSRKVHHFAHANGSDCVGAIESALHKMAKDILQEHKILMLPPTKHNKTGEQIVFKNVEVEVFDKELSLRPDCVGYDKAGQFIWVEFKRTHEVDVRKAGKIISARINCVEIDLNSCNLDPKEVRGFIEESIENRKWIYTHENPQTLQSQNNICYALDDELDDYFYFDERMQRHIAIDEQNTIVNLYNLDEIDTNKHSYFCIACGKEVYISIDDCGNYSFLHLDEKSPCEDDFYLHEAAKKVLCKKFNNKQKFDVYIPQSHLCERGNQCSLFNEANCSIALPILYDLKAHGYDSCEMEYKFPNNNFSYDAVLKRGNDLKTAIVIIIAANRCHIEPENLKNRAIEIIVKNESDIFNLYEKPLYKTNARFYNFEDRYVKTVPLEKVDRKILKFTLYSSGKYYLGAESCISKKKRTAIYEIVISNGYSSSKAMKQYAVLHCYNQQKVLCLCEICLFLKSVDGFYGHEDICSIYKKKGTPRNPLVTMPIKCPYFSLDRNLEAALATKARHFEFIDSNSNCIILRLDPNYSPHTFDLDSETDY